MAAINMMESLGALAAGSTDIVLRYLDAGAGRNEPWQRWQDWGKVAIPAVGALGVWTNTMPRISNGAFLGGIPMVLSLVYDTVVTGGAMGGGALRSMPSVRRVQQVSGAPQVRFTAPSVSGTVSRVGYVPGGLPPRPVLGR